MTEADENEIVDTITQVSKEIDEKLSHKGVPQFINSFNQLNRGDTITDPSFRSVINKLSKKYEEKDIINALAALTYQKLDSLEPERKEEMSQYLTSTKNLKSRYFNPRANILGKINRYTSRNVKNTFRSLNPLQSNTNYSKYSTEKLIQLLTHSLPDSDRAEKVLKALNEKIENAKTIKEKLELHKQLASTTKKDIYGKSESVLTAAARYGHQGVVNKLLDFDSQVKKEVEEERQKTPDSQYYADKLKYKSFKDYEIKKRGEKVHSLGNYIGEKGAITTKQRQRKFYNSEKLAAAAAISAVTIFTGGIAGAGFAVAGVGISFPVIAPMLSSIVASACSATAAGAATLATTFSSIAASSGITGMLTAAGNILAGATAPAATAVGSPLALAGVGASGQAAAGGAIMGTLAGVSGYVTGRAVAEANQPTEIKCHNLKIDDNGNFVKSDTPSYKIIATNRGVQASITKDSFKKNKNSSVEINYPLIDKNHKIVNPEFIESLVLNNEGKITSISYYKTNGDAAPTLLDKIPENCKSAFDQKWVKNNSISTKKILLPFVDSMIGRLTNKQKSTEIPVVQTPNTKSKGKGGYFR